MAATVGIRELKDNASSIVGGVELGSEVIITRHGKPVARMVPVSAPPEIQGLIDTGKATWGGAKLQLPEPVTLSAGVTVSDQVVADRER